MKEQKIFISLNGEGGEFKVKDIVAFLKLHKSNLTPQQFAGGADYDLLALFFKEYF